MGEFFEFEGTYHKMQVYCNTRNTRDGFAHEAHAVMTAKATGLDVFNGDATVHYLNRTWERYTYQTVMRKLVRAEVDALVANLRKRWMLARGWERMTAKRREEWEHVLARFKDKNDVWRVHKLVSLLDILEQIGN